MRVRGGCNSTAITCGDSRLSSRPVPVAVLFAYICWPRKASDFPLSHIQTTSGLTRGEYFVTLPMIADGSRSTTIIGLVHI